MVTTEEWTESQAENAVGGDDTASLGSFQELEYYGDNESEDSELSLESGYGVPIVKLCGREEAGQQFELDEAALAQLVARAGAARPVVLLSVAGAFRGGKSFLLGFMLRYLRALAETGQEPAGDAWLGAEEEPLRGFSWRGGCERDTTGILLWSEPFPVTLPSGEEVVVLLMDTQGAFDEHSSLRDCSLVFALSTLLASTQVYNVAGQLREDALQHLQLFTEYAAAGGSGLAELWLLLRDWSAPYEYEYGATGGAHYLQHKLRIAEEQPREARELRRRLATSFEELSCFLMPHPGLRAATDPAFQGKLSELTDEFKLALRELVPLLLAPARLRVKRVAGRPLTARELPVLLRTYLDEFNTRVPSPHTVLSAAARAAWMCAREEARARVSAAAPARALSRGPLRARLSAAALDALQPLVALAERADDLPGLAEFEKELDTLVNKYAEINDRRVDLAIAIARDGFEKVVRELEREGLCLHPLDLAGALAGARVAAACLQLHEDGEPAAEDPELVQLARDLEERSEAVLKRLSAVNAANNSAAVEAAGAAAREWLARALPRTCVGAAALAAAHADARRLAGQVFQRRRNKPTTHEYDEFIIELDEVLERQFNTHKEQNAINNRAAIKEALETYESIINFTNGFWRPAFLAAKHEEVQMLVLKSFYGSRDESDCCERDEFVEELETQLLRLYDRIRRDNGAMNKAAVDEIFDRFCSTMDGFCVGLRRKDSDLEKKLQDARDDGRRVFLRRRVDVRPEFQDGGHDLYLQTLLEIMERRFQYYREKNRGRLTGLQVTGIVVGVVAFGATLVLGAPVVVAAVSGAAETVVAEAAVVETSTAVVSAVAATGGALLNMARRI